MKETTLQLVKWRGNFGRAYTRRNALTLPQLDTLYKGRYGISRTAMNKAFLGGLRRSLRILEVGANIGNQLRCLQAMGFTRLYGVEPQAQAARLLKKRAKGLTAIAGDSFSLPFKDASFELVFTSGVLIHIAPQDIAKALKEIYRCSARYIWGFEYFSRRYQGIDYRGQKQLLWKADFPEIYRRAFRGLKTVRLEFFKYREGNNVDVMFLLEK